MLSVIVQGVTFPPVCWQGSELLRAQKYASKLRAVTGTPDNKEESPQVFGSRHPDAAPTAYHKPGVHGRAVEREKTCQEPLSVPGQENPGSQARAGCSSSELVPTWPSAWDSCGHSGAVGILLCLKRDNRTCHFIWILVCPGCSNKIQ